MARPSGARPQPCSGRRESDRGFPTPTQETNEASARPSTEFAPRSASSLSHRRAQSALSNYSSVTSRTGRALVQQPYSGMVGRDNSEGPPTILKPSEVVPSATYIERGQRWMEKEEAVALREAMEDMDLKKEEEEETRIHAAAQDEASELVYQHQHPEEAVKPDAPYRYKDHLRKNSYQHARTQSVGRYGGIGMVTGLARDVAPRSVSGGSSSSGGMHSQRSRVSSGSSDYSKFDRNASPETGARESSDYSREVPSQSTTHKSYGSISSGTRPQGSSRRRSSAKRNISGEIAGTFTGEQIWEEPEQESPDRGRSTEARDIPAPLRIKPKNPLNRVQFAQDLTPRSNSTPPEPIKKLSIFEIHRNPPSQSRDPAYTSNPPPPKTSGPESASERPPVPEKDTKDGIEIRSDEIRQATSMRLKDRSPKLPTPTVVSDKPGRPIVSFDKNWKPREADDKPEVRRRSIFDRGTNGQRQSIPARSDPIDIAAPGPTINFPDSSSIEVTHTRAATVPIINLPDSAPPVPTINFPDAPSISVSAPDVPTINVESSAPNSSGGKRPLPDPKTTARPPPRHHATAPVSRGHWSPAGKRATATCHQCQLPIEGRVVALRGATERFHPQCFICFTCGTGLEALEISPEPEVHRAQRIDRIQRRARGEELPEIEGQTMAEDGDERLRYFCHLDWHEHFAPRCKHCKTPIIGEHTVALGEHWHFGHFFCAECGDPFEKGMSHIEKDGYAWCLNCQTKRTERRAPKCLKCKQPVIGEYVQAMGGEWHDRCFRCATCRGAFDDGSFFPKEVGNETVVVCRPCMERELKA